MAQERRHAFLLSCFIERTVKDNTGTDSKRENNVGLHEKESQFLQQETATKTCLGGTPNIWTLRMKTRT